MRHYRPLVLILLFMAMLMTLAGATEKSLSGELLIRSMKATGANLQEGSVHGWTRLSMPGCSVSQLEQLIRQALETLGESPDAWRTESAIMPEQVTVHARSNAQSRSMAITARMHNPSEPEVYMTVSMAGAAEDLADWRRQTEKILHQAGGMPRISTCLVGWIDGKLNNGEWSNILLQSFAVLDATVIDTLSDSHIQSVTGYSPRLPARLAVGAVKMNVNIASRYSSYDNRTYITLGSPVIAREY